MPENRVAELVDLFSRDDTQQSSVRLAAEHPADLAAALQEIERGSRVVDPEEGGQAATG